MVSELVRKAKTRTVNGVTCIYARDLAHAVGLTARLSATDVTFTDYEGSSVRKALKLTVGETHIPFWGTGLELCVAPFVDHNQEFVPLRDVAEYFDMKVK